MRRFILVTSASLACFGCKTEDNNAPPIDGYCDTDDHLCETSGNSSATGGGTGTTAASTAGTSPDTTAGECGEMALYHCRGWRAGVYKNGTMFRFDFSSSPGVDGPYAECLEFDACFASLGEPDNEMIFEACEEVARNEYASPTWPTNPPGLTNWTLVGTQYIFAPDGNNGAVEPWQGSAVLGSVPGYCNNIPELGGPSIVPQIELEGCVPDGQCPAESESCVGYDPSTKVSSSLNSSTLTYTTTVNKVWLDALKDDLFDPMYACDDGFWTFVEVGSKWKMKGLTTGDLLYKMGFRNNDEQLRIKKSGTSTWYNLYGSTSSTGFAAMADAFGALAAETSFALEFKRGTSTYKMNLTLN